MTARLRDLWRRFQDWRTWRAYRRYVARAAVDGVGDAETEAMAEGLRCPEDWEPCRCVGGCERYGYPADLTRTARAKWVAVGRTVAAMRQVAFYADDEPEVVRKAEEAEAILARAREADE